MAQTRGRGQIVDKGKGKWLVRVFRGRDGTGKKLYFSKVVVGSKSDAQKFLTAKYREKDIGVFIDSSRQTLNDHLDTWLEVVQGRVARQTAESYKMLLRVHVRPLIGHMRLADIKIPNVQRLYLEMSKQGRSPRTIRYTHTVLSMAMKKAVELDYIMKNPCDFVELPKVDRVERSVFSSEQARSFLESASKTKNGIIFELALITGARPEEYLALRWSDVDLSEGIVKIDRALVWNRAGGGYSFGKPKTTKSRRNIPIPPQLSEKLKVHRRHQLESRLKLGGAYENQDLVFATELGTPINSRNLAQRQFREILKRIGLDGKGFVLYSLRHTCATLLMASGENPKIVAERLGHTTIKMTLDTYSHVMPDMQATASAKLGRMMYG